MGANQSSGDGGSGTENRAHSSHVRTCYYELLEIDAKASEDEIKKAYRKKALELHPDRNYGQVEVATKRFADIQSAYEVLSDPQERAWYDAHRDSILRAGDFGRENDKEDVGVMTSADILQFLSRSSGNIEFSAFPNGVYVTLNDVFERLAKEEEAASKREGLEPARYPPFGHRNDSYEDVVWPFYSTWSGFATRKLFYWKDVYRYSDAPDRKIRRIMEKKNRQLREDGIREFNDAVRSLVAFVRKRDPRSKQNKQSEADRQKTLRDAAAAQAARSRAANQAKLAEEALPEWMRPTSAETDVFDEGGFEENSTKQEVECVVCNKVFRSVKQFEAHENSKKHVKAVQLLRRRMLQENQNLNLDGIKKTDDPFSEIVNDTKDLRINGKHDCTNESEENWDQDSRQKVDLTTEDRNMETPMSYKPGTNLSAPGSYWTLDDEYASHEEDGHIVNVENQDAGHSNALNRDPSKSQINTFANPMDVCASDDVGINKKPHMGKAKERRAKKAAQKLLLEAESGCDFNCAACGKFFPSKNQLFKHIKMAGHAQSITKATANR